MCFHNIIRWKKQKSKKGIYFTIDSIIAVALIFLSLHLVVSSYREEQQENPTYQKASDLVKVFSSTKVRELNNSYVQQLIANGTITRTNNTVLEQLGEFWATNQDQLAQDFISSIASGIVSPQFGVSIHLDEQQLYAQPKNVQEVLISSRKIITGIAKDKPIEGFTSKAFLSSIQEKKNFAYAYFGGFVGQGNITVFLDGIPGGSVIRALDMEVDAGSSFNLFINGAQCLSTFAPGSEEMTADHWNISSCISSMQAGQKNYFDILFIGDISTAYVGGGFIRATYTTDVLESYSEGESDRVFFPEIAGIINLYSSFYVPGTLNGMNLSLHYSATSTNASNNTLYVTIGNKTVVKITNASGEGWVRLNSSNLSTQLSYAELSQKTVPLRIGFENVSFSSYFFGNADVGLITDVSGSMDWRMDLDWVDGIWRNCNDAQLQAADTRRLSVAKCLDLEFALDILNVTGNAVGLVSFSDTTQAGSTVYPTTNYTRINQTVGTSIPLTGYNANGGTCICCGINSAKDILVQSVGNMTLIPRGASWLFSNYSFGGAPAADPSGNEWYFRTYSNESSWFTGNAILGATNGNVYSPVVVTEMGSGLNGQSFFADFWERGGDIPGPPADFTSGQINSTGNTYGIGGANDGWDWDSRDGVGPFGYDDDIDYNNVTGQKLELDTNFGGGGNICSANDCSGAYGILLNITPEAYAILQGRGTATLSFDYEWDDVTGNVFESADQVWVKARWTSPVSGAYYLGTDDDSGDDGSDADPEIESADNPDNDFSGFYSGSVGQWIEGPGMYYVEIGGKLRASSNNEYGWWRFDNIQLIITNITDHYYLRKHFTIPNLALARKGVLNVLSDDSAEVYLNGNLVDLDQGAHDAAYWNRRGKNVLGEYFVEGDNVIAVHLANKNKSAKFDLELIGLNDSRDKMMMVMTDGQANLDAPCPQTGTPSEEAVQAACEAREDWGITVFAVGYSDAADNVTLQQIAACGGGTFAKSNNATALQEFYQDVASSIVSLSRHAQTIELTGDLIASVLFGDSSIGLNYTPQVVPPQFGEIGLDFEQRNFLNCTFNVSIPSGIRITDAKLTSYSSEHWTDGLVVNQNTVYNLSYYNPDYTTLGDPFLIAIPPAVLMNGNNTFIIRTGDTPDNTTGCSKNNTLIYTGAITSSVSYTDVLATADGCRWTVETETSAQTIDIPSDYSGSNACSYTSSNISYNPSDGTAVAAYNLFRGLDFDLNGKVNVDIAEQDLQIESIYVSQVPSLWGPTIAEVRVWQ